ncbi:MAG: Flp pilus assembly complex ATPase component TadA [Dehalococcoidia bacterium]|nr:Flp pilus assembly complex ATPase component TadA [Dehalococcoidia bacterium]
MAQKQSDQIVAKLVERLRLQGYEVRPNAALRGKSIADHTFDYLVLRRDGFMNLLAAVEVINDAEDPETSLHKLFAFQDKCSECDIDRSVVIAIPRLSFVASQFAQKDGVDVFDEQAVQMFLNRAPAPRPSAKEMSLAFLQKAEVHQALKTLGYRVDESVKVAGDSGTEHVFGAMALWDDGFILSRLGIDYLSGDSVDKTQLSAFSDKCRDAGITERMLLIPKELTDEARRFAEQNRIEVVSLDGRRKELAPDAAASSPTAFAKQGTVPSEPGSVDADKPSKESVPTADKAGEKKRVIVVSEVKSSRQEAPGQEAIPAPGKAATPAGTESGSGSAIAPVESPYPARAFSMRSVIDQFLGPQVKPKPVQKDTTQVGSEAVEPAAGAVAQVKGVEVKTAEAKSIEAKTAPVAEKPADGKAPQVEVGVAAPAPSADKIGGVRTPDVKAADPKATEIKTPDIKPEPSVVRAAVVPQVKPAEAKAVLVAERSNGAQAKPVEAKAPGHASDKSGQAKVVVPVAKGEVSPRKPGEERADKQGMIGQAQDGAAAGVQPQKSAGDKGAQARVVIPVTKGQVSPRKLGEERTDRQGVVGKPQSGSAMRGQPLKPGGDKPGIDKSAVQGGQAKIPAKPHEPPKPMVEEEAPKPKVKLRKATRPEALQLVPEATARRFTVLPIGVTDNVLEVAMVNPSDLATIQVLEMQSKMRIRAFAAEQKEILDAIDFNYKGFGQIAEQISHIETGADAASGVDLVAATANAPVAAALNLIVEEAVKARASDIHIEPEEKRLRIRYRIDGVLHEVMSLPIKIHPPLTSRVKVMSDLNIADHLRPQDGQFSLEVKGKSIDVRVATSPTVHGETVVMRLLDKSLAIMELPELGFTPDCLEKYMKMLAVPFGMICVSGPTGAGKTTTLYASLNTMDKVTRNIITVEDPVEYRFEGIKQIQVNAKAGLTFASVLRSMMRLDPDVILVGEIRDAETAGIAVKSALTGHTVLCSIHANDAVSVVYRLLDLGVESFMVASVITGTIAQRMARRVCANCAQETKPTEVEAAAYESVMGEKLQSYLSGSGCDLCSFSGYKGRLGLYEVLAMTDSARALILKGATTAELRDQAVKDGMVTLFKDGMQKVKAGQTTVSEVLRNAYSID